MRIAILLMCASAFGQVSEETSKAMAVPSLPLYDWGACPGEYCAYKEWTAHQPVTVYDTWKDGRRVVGQLAAGDNVSGLRGVVVTLKPGVIRMDRDLAEQNLRREDTILTYGASSEGFSAVWFKGRYHSQFDISFTKWPDGSGCGNGHCAATYLDLGKKSWWAEVKLPSGQTGWVELDLGKIPVALF